MTDADRGPEGPVGPPPTTRNPQMTVSVSFEEPSPEDEGTKPMAKVFIDDSSHPYLRALMQYVIIDAHGGFRPVGFSVTQVVGENLPDEFERLGPGAIKDLPITRWDRVAQAAVTRALARSVPSSITTQVGVAEAPDRSDEAAATLMPVPSKVAVSRRDRAIQVVSKLRPDLVPSKSKGAARSWNGLVKLAEAVDEHSEEMVKGVPDPVAVMAERHGVAPATVRTWLHRARQAGITMATLATSGAGNAESIALGTFFAEARESAGITLEELAKASDISVSTIKEIEGGNIQAAGGGAWGRLVIAMLARNLGLDRNFVVAEYEKAIGGADNLELTVDRTKDEAREAARKVVIEKLRAARRRLSEPADGDDAPSPGQTM